MKGKERTLYHLQRTLLRRHFGDLPPRPVALVDSTDFDGRVGAKLELKPNLAERPFEAESLLLHLLIHCELAEGGHLHWRGHGPFFRRRCEELGLGDPDKARCYAIEDWLNDAKLREGPHALKPRVIDIVFGLVRGYRRELLEAFSAPTFDLGSSAVPESLRPWATRYAVQITNLLSMQVDLDRLASGKA